MLKFPARVANVGHNSISTKQSCCQKLRLRHVARGPQQPQMDTLGRQERKDGGLAPLREMNGETSVRSIVRLIANLCGWLCVCVRAL